MAEANPRKRAAQSSPEAISTPAQSKKQRLPSTCEWIKQEAAYRSWIDGDAEALSILWIHGPPGCGKSFLAQYIVDELRDRLEQQGMAAYFCDETSSPSGLMRSTIVQLLDSQRMSAEEKNAISQRLENLEDGREAIVDHTFALWDIFEEVVQKSSGSTLVIDGVDELPVRYLSNRDFAFLERLVQLFTQRPQENKLCIISRTDSRLRDILAKYPTVDITAEKLRDDVRNFATAAAHSYENLTLLVDQIVPILTQRSEGIFKWVQLSVEALGMEVGEGNILDRLENLPQSLDDLYAGILTKSTAQLRRADIRIRDSILRWLVTAVRPISQLELGHAIAIGENAFVRDIERKAFDVCGSLIKVESGVLKAMHHSLRDFLQGDRTDVHMIASIESGPAHTVIAQTCIMTLSHPAFTEPLEGLPSEIEDILSNYPFLEYATLYWIYHVSQTGFLEVGLKLSIKKFFESPNAFTWLDSFLPAMLARSVLPVPPRPRNSARFAYIFSLKSELVKRFEGTEKADFDAQFSDVLSTSYEAALADAIAQHGSSSLQALQRRLDCGEVYGWLPGRRGQSEALFRDAMSVVHSAEMETSLDLDVANLTVAVYQAQADALKRGGKYEEARDLLIQLLRLLEIQQRQLPSLSSIEARKNSIYALDSLGWVFMRLNNLEDARKHLDEALQLAMSLYGQTSPLTLRCKTTLAEVLNKLGRIAEAEELCEELIVQVRKHGENGIPLPRDAVSQLNILAAIYMAQKKFRSAVETYTMVVEDRKKGFGGEHPMTLWAIMQLEIARQSRAEFEGDEEALKDVRAALENLVPTQASVLGESHPDVREVRERLTRLSEKFT